MYFFLSLQRKRWSRLLTDEFGLEILNSPRDDSTNPNSTNRSNTPFGVKATDDTDTDPT